MPDTFTTNYGWTKPEVGASDDTWGDKTNTNWDSVDTKVFSVEKSVSAKTYLLRSVAGSATAITAQTGFSLSALTEHMMLRFKPAFNSTGAATISIDGITAVPLRSPTGAELGTDDIHTSFYYDAVTIGTPVTEIRICRF